MIQTRPIGRKLLLCFAFIVWLVLTCEFLQWKASPANDSLKPDEHPVSVVVLGLPDYNFVLRAIQHWRVAMAMNVCNQFHCTQLIFSGGHPSGGEAEANTMANHALQQGLDPEKIIIEDRSNTTWENIANSMKLIKDSNQIIIVSDALHARRALQYWKVQNPKSKLCISLADNYQFLDHFWLKTPCTIVEIFKWARDRITNYPSSSSTDSKNIH